MTTHYTCVECGCSELEDPNVGYTGHCARCSEPSAEKPTAPTTPNLCPYCGVERPIDPKTG